MEVYIGIPIHNCINYTIVMLDSIVMNKPFKLIIVDNGSTDETPSLLNDLEKKGQIIIRNKTNLGVSKSWNQIINKALEDPECKYIFILNNDIILELSTLNQMVEFVSHHTEYSLISGINTRSYAKQTNNVTEPALFFSCFLMTKECVEKVGLFDENYGIGSFEDNDYLEKIRVAGCKSCTVLNIGFFHYGQRTIDEGELNIDFVRLHKKKQALL